MVAAASVASAVGASASKNPSHDYRRDAKKRAEAVNIKSLRDSGGVDTELLNRAVGALLKRQSSLADGVNKKDLLGGAAGSGGGGSPVLLQIGLSRAPSSRDGGGNGGGKPVRVDIPHPIVRVPRLEGGDDDDDDDDDAIMGGGDEDYLDDVEVCLMVKDDITKTKCQSIITKFPSHLSSIKKVLTLDSLRKKYGEYKDRRDLLRRFDVFLADDRILPMLGKSLGKSFFAAKKQPLPVRVTRELALPFVINKCLRSTFMYLGRGTCVVIK